MGYGVDNLAASILAILYFEPDEVSMEDIAARTGYSLASISQKIKSIEKSWRIQRIKKPGSRKVFFYMEKDLLELLFEQLKAGYENELKILNKKILPLIEEYKKESVSDEQISRLQIFETYKASLDDLQIIFDCLVEKVEETKKEREKLLSF